MDAKIEAAALAKHRAAGGRRQLAAVLIRECGDPGTDGRAWECAVIDGLGVIAVKAELSGSNGGGVEARFEPEFLEAAVEWRLDRSLYESARLLEDVAEAGDIILQREDLRSDPPGSGESVFDH